MTKPETLTILAILSAFYGQGKAQPHAMLNAWHMILKDYDYPWVEYAVVCFAKTDNREYASFPSIGQILGKVEESMKYVNGIHNSALDNIPYATLPDHYKELISENQYKNMTTWPQDNNEYTLKKARRYIMPKPLYDEPELLED